MIIKCSNCQELISDKATICPHCKAQVQPQHNNENTKHSESNFTFRAQWLISTVVIGIALGIYGTINNGYSYYNSFFDRDLVQCSIGCLVISLIVSLLPVFINKWLSVSKLVLGVLCVVSLSLVGYSIYDRNMSEQEQGRLESERELLAPILGQTWNFTDERGSHSIVLDNQVSLYESDVYVKADFDEEDAFPMQVQQGEKRYGFKDTPKGLVYVFDLAEGTVTIRNTNDNTSQTLKLSFGQESTNGWTYDEEIDDLTNKRVAVSATLESLNTNPYNAKGDETKMLLVLRYGKLGFAVQNGVMLCLAEGGEHYDCKYADSFGSGFLAVFDDGEIDETWRLVSKPDKNALVVTDSQEANDFITKVKNAHTCKLQVNIDGIGMKTFTFNVKGLEWDY